MQSQVLVLCFDCCQLPLRIWVTVSNDSICTVGYWVEAAGVSNDSTCTVGYWVEAAGISNDSICRILSAGVVWMHRCKSSASFIRNRTETPASHPWTDWHWGEICERSRYSCWGQLHWLGQLSLVHVVDSYFCPFLSLNCSLFVCVLKCWVIFSCLYNSVICWY